MKPKISKQEFEKAFDSLLKSYPVQAHSSVQKDRSKYYEELLAIEAVLANNNSDIASLNVLDVGGGSGNLCVLVKTILGCNVSMVDRLDEFDDEHERVMGNRQDVIDRLQEANIKFIDADPFVDIYCETEKFDMILNFDVIEHLPHGVPGFIEKMYQLLKSGGSLILSTPNQVHLKNRVSALLGKNTWEDFDYYITTEQFFGHVRELTCKELEFLLCKYQNYEVTGRTHQLNRYGKTFSGFRIIKPILKYVIDRNARLSYQLFGVVKKCN